MSSYFSKINTQFHRKRNKRWVAAMTLLKERDEIRFKTKFLGQTVHCYYRVNRIGKGSREITFAMFDKPLHDKTTKCQTVYTLWYTDKWFKQLTY